MTRYVVTTGILFGLLTVAHLLRMTQERDLATDPMFLLLTAVSAALGIWAWRLVRRTRRS